MTTAPVRVGDLLRGFCSGHFGRDSHDDKRVEAVGSDWVVARELPTGRVVFASFPEREAWRVDDLAEHRGAEPENGG